jgi:hypothetical protein
MNTELGMTGEQSRIFDALEVLGIIVGVISIQVVVWIAYLI